MTSALCMCCEGHRRGDKRSNYLKLGKRRRKKNFELELKACTVQCTVVLLQSFSFHSTPLLCFMQVCHVVHDTSGHCCVGATPVITPAWQSLSTICKSLQCWDYTVEHAMNADASLWSKPVDCALHSRNENIHQSEVSTGALPPPSYSSSSLFYPIHSCSPGWNPPSLIFRHTTHTHTGMHIRIYTECVNVSPAWMWELHLRHGRFCISSFFPVLRKPFLPLFVTLVPCLCTCEFSHY